MIFIPTYNRVGFQNTIKRFPPEWYGNLVNLVCLESEQHIDLPCIHIPPEHGSTISKKRQWILEYGRCNDLPWIMMVDDNVWMKVLDSSCSIPEAIVECVEQFLESDLDVVYFNYYFRHQDRLGSRNPRIIDEQFVIATNTYLIKPNRIPDHIDFLMSIYEDAHFSLSCLENGIRVGMYHNLLTQPSGNIGLRSGGNREDPNYTVLECIEDSLIEFHNSHKKYTSIKEVPIGKGKRGSRLKLTMKLKKAYEENRILEQTLDNFTEPTTEE